MASIRFDCGGGQFSASTSTVTTIKPCILSSGVKIALASSTTGFFSRLFCMSTSCDVPPQLISGNQHSETTQNVDPVEDERENSQSGRKDNLTSRKENISQTFTNANVGDVLLIPDWPRPQTLEVTRGESILHNTGYILLLVPPLIFLVLVLSAIGLHLERPSPYGEFISRTCLLGPTAFPIAFSAILGWCLKTYGRYQAERGIKLGVNTTRFFQ